jgi:putative hemolysin
MDTSTALGLVAVAFLIATNGFFVATEFAIVAVRKSRLEQLAAEGVHSARCAADGGAARHLHRCLSARHYDGLARGCSTRPFVGPSAC